MKRSFNKTIINSSLRLEAGAGLPEYCLLCLVLVACTIPAVSKLGLSLKGGFEPVSLSLEFMPTSPGYAVSSSIADLGSNVNSGNIGLSGGGTETTQVPGGAILPSPNQLSSASRGL